VIRLQEAIHKIEEAGWKKHIRLTLAFFAAALLALVYNLRAAKNMTTQEAMDSAQLARNIADGKGYTTFLIRPFSMYLISETARASSFGNSKTNQFDLARIRGGHPDISNPPVYPAVLAGLIKVLPFDFSAASIKRFFSRSGKFWRYQPDFLIAWFNELLLAAVVVLVFFWARRLFDIQVAATSAILLFASELLWHFSSSGLSTMLLLLIFMGVVWSLTLLESELSEPKRGPKALYGLGIAVGVLTGLGGMTRYGFAWLILPILGLICLIAGARRAKLSATIFISFALVMTPWIVRNLNLSGVPFGTATYSILDGGGGFSGDTLERSLNPDINISLHAIWIKLLVNSQKILQGEFFFLGGGWLMALFLAGLLIGFRNPAIRRMRYFLIGSLFVLVLVQALGRTHLSDDSPVINSENYIVILFPMIAVFGVALFYMLLDQMSFPWLWLRKGAIGVFCILACLPMIFALLPPRNIPIAYPPYLPPVIERSAGLLKPNELMMTDVPWAVAWYGHRQSVWLTLDALPDPDDTKRKENFFTINDYQKPISALYLTPETLDMRFKSGLIEGGNYGWGNLILTTLLKKEVPSPFPLRAVAPDFMPEQLLLLDWPRWKNAHWGDSEKDLEKTPAASPQARANTQAPWENKESDGGLN
jgi:hypothetical protein